MSDKAKQDYIRGLERYHKLLELAVQKHYGVDTNYLEVVSWGYHTTAMYIKSDTGKEYLLKLADSSEKKEQGIQKDLELSVRLHGVIPTPSYIKTLNNGYTCRFENKILRLSHYISGLAPLNMTYAILGQMTSILSKIHGSAPPTGVGHEVLLHGDLTPHNVLVSHDQIIAVMDFEMSFVGPKEWDLAKTAFFSWNYLPEVPFKNVAQFVLKSYGEANINRDLFHKLTLEHAQTHLDSVVKHRPDYDRQADWQKDFAFAQKQLQKLTG